MNLPNSWDSILVDQYIELRELDSSLDYFDLMLETISIVTDTDIEELEDYSFPELVDMEKQLTWLTSEPSKNINKRLDLFVGNKDHDGGAMFWTDFGLLYIGLDNLKLGEFIDLNHFFAENFVTNLPTICAILYRQTKLNEWNETIIEPYEYDPRNRGELFMEVGITQVYGIIGSFLEYKSNFEADYASLFKPDLSDEDTSELSEEDLKEIEEEERLDAFSWERVILTLCQDLNVTPDEALNLSVTFVFNMLSMKKAMNL